jgi:hypothetical protein
MLLVALLGAINRDVQGFRQTDEHFMVFPSTMILALASTNPRDLGSFPLPTSLYSLLQALRCKHYKSHPPFAGSRDFSSPNQDK